jgi:hypothetical protein
MRRGGTKSETEKRRFISKFKDSLKNALDSSMLHPERILALACVAAQIYFEDSVSKIPLAMPARTETDATTMTAQNSSLQQQIQQDDTAQGSSSK